MTTAEGQGYQNSSSFYQGFVDAMRELGLFERVRGALSPAQLAALEHPRSQRWWPGAMLASIVEVIEQQTDTPTLEKLAFLAVKKAVFPVAMPLIKVTIAISGSSPDTILSRASTFGATALRGVKMDWKRDGATSGVFTCVYPEAVPPQYGALWRGTLQFVFDLTKVKGEFGEPALMRGGTELQLPLKWT